MTSEGPTRRINRGRSHAYEIDGRKVDSVTSVLSPERGLASPAILNYGPKAIVDYAVNHWDELAEKPISERIAELQRSRYESRDVAKNRGTEIHTLAMKLAAGEEVEVPEPIQGHIEAYLAFVEAWEPHELLVEVPVFNRLLGYAGTPDLIAELVDGAIWLLDWKTGSGIYPDAALQLSAYRFAEFYLGPEGDELPLPPIDRVGAVWLRADGFDLYPVTADLRAFKLWQYAREIARYNEAGRDEFVSEALEAPARSAA